MFVGEERGEIDTRDRHTWWAHKVSKLASTC